MDEKIVKTIVRKCLGCRKNEEFLIVCDDEKESLASKFYNIARSIGIKPVLIRMTPTRMHGEEPPETVAEALKKSDVAVLFTSMSLSHTKARKIASSRYGTRIASLPGVTEGMLDRSILIDYQSLKRKVKYLAGLLTKAGRLELRTKKGTNLVMSIDKRKGFPDDGLYVKKRAFGNLPAGEVCISPVEGTTEGRLIIDGSAPFVGRIKNPKEIIIKNGYAKNMPFPRIKSLIRSIGRDALNVAELGIGLNPKAKLTGNILEDEKVFGTGHVALGNNKSFGGRVGCPVHLDFVFFDPVILLDDVRVDIKRL